MFEKPKFDLNFQESAVTLKGCVLYKQLRRFSSKVVVGEAHAKEG